MVFVNFIYSYHADKLLLTGQKFGFAGEGMTPPGCPPGLEYLAQLDELQLNQKVDVLESMYLLIGWMYGV